MKSPHLLISADIFREAHVQAVAAAAAGWATWERVPETVPASELAAKLAYADIMVGWAPADLLLASPITLYLCGSAGLDAYLGCGLEYKPGYVHCNASGTMSIPIAEHALALMFALARRLPTYWNNQREKRFARIRDGREITGSTACIAGLGGSGSELAARCRALGMNVVGVRRRAGQPHAMVSRVHPLEELPRAVAGADHVFCTLPAGPLTARAFDAQVFAAMKPGACFYNVSRGSLVDEPALVSALHSGHLAGAGLDVAATEPPPADSPLWDCPNILLTGHSAGWSVKLADRLCDLFVTNLLNRRDGRPLVNVVDLAAAGK